MWKRDWLVLRECCPHQSCVLNVVRNIVALDTCGWVFGEEHVASSYEARLPCHYLLCVPLPTSTGGKQQPVTCTWLQYWNIWGHFCKDLGTWVCPPHLHTPLGQPQFYPTLQRQLAILPCQTYLL